MFFTIMSVVTFWLFVSEFSYFLSKFTTIGTRPAFGDWVFEVESFVRFTLKWDYAATLILSLSYSKLFICRPCHTFWLTLAAHLFIITWYWAILAALVAYGVAENIESHAKKQIEKRADRTRLFDGSEDTETTTN